MQVTSRTCPSPSTWGQVTDPSRQLLLTSVRGQDWKWKHFAQMFLCHDPRLSPSPRLPTWSDQHRLFPKPSWLQHLDFPFRSSGFPPVLLNLEISPSGASQAAASSNISVHQLLPLGWGFPPRPGPAESLGIRKILQIFGIKWDLGLGPCSRMSFSQEYLQKTNSMKEGKPLQN